MKVFFQWASSNHRFLCSILQRIVFYFSLSDNFTNVFYNGKFFQAIEFAFGQSQLYCTAEWRDGLQSVVLLNCRNVRCIENFESFVAWKANEFYFDRVSGMEMHFRFLGERQLCYMTLKYDEHKKQESYVSEVLRCSLDHLKFLITLTGWCTSCITQNCHIDFIQERTFYCYRNEASELVQRCPFKYRICRSLEGHAIIVISLLMWHHLW